MNEISIRVGPKTVQNKALSLKLISFPDVRTYQWRIQGRQKHCDIYYVGIYVCYYNIDFLFLDVGAGILSLPPLVYATWQSLIMTHFTCMAQARWMHWIVTGVTKLCRL